MSAIVKRKMVAITIDVEDWFQVENLRSVYDHSKWNSAESHVEKNTEKILEVLAEKNIKATFFVLGWIAQKYRSSVRKISEEGHEIASHGFSHVLNYNLSLTELREDLDRSKKLLEDIVGKEVIGYRAPSFSINDKVLGILAELGYKYDSSFNSFSIHDRYGTISNFVLNRPFVHDSGIVEFPMPVMNLGKFSVPISGGGYFRIYPFWLFKLLVKRYLEKNDLYVFYLHPWEIDAEQPVVRNIPLTYKIRHYTGLSRCLEKFGRFLTIIRQIVQKSTNLTELIDLTLSGIVVDHLGKQESYFSDEHEK